VPSPNASGVKTIVAPLVSRAMVRVASNSRSNSVAAVATASERDESERPMPASTVAVTIATATVISISVKPRSPQRVRPFTGEGGALGSRARFLGAGEDLPPRRGSASRPFSGVPRNRRAGP